MPSIKADKMLRKCRAMNPHLTIDEFYLAHDSWCEWLASKAAKECNCKPDVVAVSSDGRKWRVRRNGRLAALDSEFRVHPVEFTTLHFPRNGAAN